MKCEALTHRALFVTVWPRGGRAATQARDSPNHLLPDCQTFPKKALAVAVGSSILLTYILNKRPNREAKLESRELEV